MKEIEKESIIVSGFVLLCILDKVKIPYMGIVVMLALPIVIGLLIYESITSANFKTFKFQGLFSIYYKMFFILALFFALKDYPGKDVMSIVAISSAILYILYTALFKAKKDTIISAILYFNLFSGFLLLMRY